MLPPPSKPRYGLNRKISSQNENDDNQSISQQSSYTDNSSSAVSYEEYVQNEQSTGLIGKPIYSTKFRKKSYYDEDDDEDDENNNEDDGIYPNIVNKKENEKETKKNFFENKTPIPFNDLVEIGPKRRKITEFTSKRLCWGCANDFLKKPAENETLNIPNAVQEAYLSISKIISNASTKMDIRTLVHSIKNIWDQQVAPSYQIREASGQLVTPTWTIEEIEEHILEHMCDPALTMLHGISKLNIFSKILENNIFYQDIGGKVYVNKDNLHSYMMIMNQRQKFHSTDTTKSFAFHTGVTPTPPKKKSINM